MKRTLKCMIAIALVLSFTVSAFAASVSYSKSLGKAKSGYIRMCDISSSTSTSTSWYIFSPSSKITVKISSNSASSDVAVNFASSTGTYLTSKYISGTGSVSYSYSSDCAVQFDNWGSATTLKGSVSTS